MKPDDKVLCAGVKEATYNRKQINISNITLEFKLNFKLFNTTSIINITLLYYIYIVPPRIPNY